MTEGRIARTWPVEPDSPEGVAPAVVSALAQAEFEVQALRMGLKPEQRWIGGYVAYEWGHLRHVLQTLPLALPGLQTLEFGCNVGASAVLMSHLGARVTAVDIEPDMVELARCNAARFGESSIDFRCVPDTRRLPFPDERFDFITCNSVLEYLPADQLRDVQRELDRVLKPGGLMLVTGTSNRLWPFEVHSGRWWLNYLPRVFDRLVGKPPMRGVWPWTMRHGFGPHYDSLDSAERDGSFARSRRLIGTSGVQVAALRLAATLLRVGPGLLAQSISCALRKRN